MPRPSRNIDKLLIKTGLEMLPETGISGMNIRDVVQRAGVNLGMFHYHFKTKEAFARICAQEIYESMFSQLIHVIDDKAPAIENLRRVITTLGRFARNNHRIMMNLIVDLKASEPVTIEFILANFPRHLQLIRTYVERCQAEASIIPHPAPLIISFLAGAVAAPPLFGGLVLQLDLPQISLLEPIISASILSDAAIDERVRMALKGVSP